MSLSEYPTINQFACRNRLFNGEFYVLIEYDQEVAFSSLELTSQKVVQAVGLEIASLSNIPIEILKQRADNQEIAIGLFEDGNLKTLQFGYCEKKFDQLNSEPILFKLEGKTVGLITNPSFEPKPLFGQEYTAFLNKHLETLGISLTVPEAPPLQENYSLCVLI